MEGPTKKTAVLGDLARDRAVHVERENVGRKPGDAGAWRPEGRVDRRQRLLSKGPALWGQVSSRAGKPSRTHRWKQNVS